MQSQQKKVKWSRGETADALEERTDTGITQVSVSKLENIIADIYGNISRRPALKIISSVPEATDLPVVSWAGSGTEETNFVKPPQSFVFTIDENTYIIFIKDTLTNNFGGLLIQDNKFVKKVAITNTTGWGLSTNNPVSAAQYNNFMVVSNLYLGDVVLRITNTNDVTVEKYQFSAPWYAPGGTQTKTVGTADVPGLEFNHSGNGFDAFAWTDDSGNSSPYSIIDTGLSGQSNLQLVSENIPVGSIIKFPNLGAYMRVEGYNLGNSTLYWADCTFASLLVNHNPPATGYAVVAWQIYNNVDDSRWNQVTAYYNGREIGRVYVRTSNLKLVVNSSVSQTGYSKLQISGHDGQYGFSWADITPDSLEVMAFGALLTPVADESGTDSTVTVEYGYISLETYQPTKFAFSGQRLYAAGFYNTEGLNTQQYIPGYAIGSQIAKYNDFKNDYNTQSEAVVIDISTSYQEKITAIIDYNGLKILTDTAEYAYMNGGVVKQSENGSLESCPPIVFGSVCLYADRSGQQIRALEYEFSSNLFQSSAINTMAKEDLIFNTVSLAGVLDKEHYTGRFLYATQYGYSRDGLRIGDPIAKHSLAVCNMVPGNQALIWSRWNMPDIVTELGYNRHIVQNAIEVNNKLWFVVACYDQTSGYRYPAYTLAELDYENNLDIEVTATSTDEDYRIIPANKPFDLYAWVDQNDPTNIVYTKDKIVMQGDPIYDADGNQISTANNSPGGPNMIIDGVAYYAWDSPSTSPIYYTKTPTPNPTGGWGDESRKLYDNNGDVVPDDICLGYSELYNYITAGTPPIPGHSSPVYAYYRVPSSSSLEYNIGGTVYTADYDSSENIYAHFAVLPRATVSVFDGDQYMWDDNLDEYGQYTKPLTELTAPRVGFMINATLESHPIDVGGKTYTEKKRIGKAVAVIRNTDAGAFTVCDKTGYTSTDKKTVNFYGCTGMKDQVRYTIKNIKGARFTIESLTMIIEYGTLES